MSHPHRPTPLGLRILVFALLASGAYPSAPAAQKRALASRSLPAADATKTAAEPDLRFAIIGDFGEAGPSEQAVADLVHALEPDLVLTVGDNNYPVGSAATIDLNIGGFYSDFIHPYLGAYGSGAATNRFFPALGNHDWLTAGAQPYLDYFELPGNERYYDVRRGNVHFFILDSDKKEPDGITVGSLQATWLQNALASSDAEYKLVFMHHAPYSSANHGPTLALQWPYAAWGVDAVFAGHDHSYERVEVDGIPYFVNGVGGRLPLYAFNAPIAGSVSRYNQTHGAMIVDVEERRLHLRFLTHDGFVLDDTWVFANDQDAAPEVLVPTDAVWSYLDSGAAAAAGWTDVGFDDSSWGSGPAQLGYGEADEATTVSFGPDPNNKFVTTYFRHEFYVADPASIDRLNAAIMADDGAILYLNGTEIGRTRMPAGAVTSTTLALSNLSGGPENSLYGGATSPGLLNAGWNAIAVEVHQSGVMTSDLSFALSLVARRDVDVLVPKRSIWRYLDDGSEQGTVWRHESYDDSGWMMGQAELGYGDGSENTVVSFGPDPNQKYVTTYFRRTFTVADPSLYEVLDLRLRRDDGAIVYLNGVEVLRYSLPLDGVDSSTLAGVGVGGGDELKFFSSRIDPALLAPGDNLLAVEIHQVGRNSSDISFDLELIGLR